MHVLIVGATSAVAQQLAVLYAKRGYRLHLVGRDAVKLQHLTNLLAGAQVTHELADFNDCEHNASLVDRALQTLGHLDLAVIAHGLLGDQLETERDYAAAQRVIATNFSSVVAFVIPLANYFERAGGGQLAVLSSVAGERGRPRNYTYGAAKGALTLYLQGVRSRLWPHVQVHTIKLGPVDSPMTIGHKKNRLFITCEQAARSIARVVDRGTAEAYVPWFWAPIMTSVRYMPEPLFQRLKFLSGR